VGVALVTGGEDVLGGFDVCHWWGWRGGRRNCGVEGGGGTGRVIYLLESGGIEHIGLDAFMFG
jgi:hypothetical protein